jgi:hypothetical protein
MTLFSKDTVIANVIDGVFIPVNFNLLPLYLQRTGNIEKWLESRAIDSSRTNARLLKRVLRLSGKSDLDTVMAVSAATITDSYWVRAEEDCSVI